MAKSGKTKTAKKPKTAKMSKKGNRAESPYEESEAVTDDERPRPSRLTKTSGNIVHSTKAVINGSTLEVTFESTQDLKCVFAVAFDNEFTAKTQEGYVPGFKTQQLSAKPDNIVAFTLAAGLLEAMQKGGITVARLSVNVDVDGGPAVTQFLNVDIPAKT